MGFGKSLLKAADPSLSLRMTVLSEVMEGERRGDSMPTLKMGRSWISNRLFFPPRLNPAPRHPERSEGSHRAIVNK